MTGDPRVYPDINEVDSGMAAKAGGSVVASFAKPFGSGDTGLDGSMKSLTAFRKEIRMSLAKRGILGTLRLANASLLGVFKTMAFSPKADGNSGHNESSDLDDFDSRFGVDTAGTVRLSSLEVESENWVHGSAYQTISCDAFTKAFNGLGLPFEQLTFIDIGSGKGRAVLLASRFPFKKVIGVEFSNELHIIAEQNLRRFHEAEKDCAETQLVCMDAIQYVLPEGPLLLYLFNPFGKPLMERFIENVNSSFAMHRRRIIVVYIVPVASNLWDKVGFLRKSREGDRVCVYDTKSEFISG